jgi:menaquinone-dependent protoporphyrinogen oxidase
MDLLVVFASSRGSTRGVAARIASRLRLHGNTAEARSVAAVDSVAAYDAVVFGSAIHGGKWLPEATRFADRNAAVLRHRPNWLFSVSTVGDEESMFPPRVAKRLRGLRGETPEIAALRDALHSREHRNFAGVIVRSEWPPTGRAFFRAMGGRYGDHRNWPAIDAWADTIAEQLTKNSAVGLEHFPG